MAPLPPVRKRKNYSGISPNDLTFALFHDRIMPNTAMREGAEDPMLNLPGATTKEASPGDYLVVEDRSKPSTWHLQVRRNGKPDHGLMGAAWAALHGGYRGNKYAGPGAAEALAKLRKLYEAEGMPIPESKELRVYKDASGGDRWLMISSTAYRDRDKEIVSTKALQGAVEQADASGMRGPLRFWHVPGVELGDCDYQATAQDGRFLIESGTFRSPAIAAAVKAHADEYQVSIGFVHPANEPDANGVYHNIAIFERSLVPVGRAANPLTRVAIMKEHRMLTPEKEAQLKSLTAGDPSLMVDLLSQVATTDKAAQDAGATFKDDLRAIIREELQGLLVEAEKAGPPAEVAPPDTPPEMKADGMEGSEAPAEEDTPQDEQQDAMEYLGDMSVSDFESMLAQALATALGPLVKGLDIAGKMGAHMDELKSMMGGYTAQKDATQAEQQAALEALKAQVADLSGSAPRILAGGFRASQAPATVTTDESKIKEAGPAADPKMAAFGSFLQDLGFTSQAS